MDRTKNNDIGAPMYLEDYAHNAALTAFLKLEDRPDGRVGEYYDGIKRSYDEAMAKFIAKGGSPNTTDASERVARAHWAAAVISAAMACDKPNCLCRVAFYELLADTLGKRGELSSLDASITSLVAKAPGSGKDRTRAIAMGVMATRGAGADREPNSPLFRAIAAASDMESVLTREEGELFSQIGQELAKIAKMVNRIADAGEGEGEGDAVTKKEAGEPKVPDVIIDALLRVKPEAEA